MEDFFILRGIKMNTCEKCVHRVACKKTKVACEHFNHMDFKSLTLEFNINDVDKNKHKDEYKVSIDTTWVMFPSRAEGRRLEVFYKKKGAKYGKFHEIGTVIINNGKFQIINW